MAIFSILLRNNFICFPISVKENRKCQDAEDSPINGWPGVERPISFTTTKTEWSSIDMNIIGWQTINFLPSQPMSWILSAALHTIWHRRKKKSPWDGSSLPCSQRLSITCLDHAVSVLYDHIFLSAAFGLTTLCFSLPVFFLRLLPRSWCIDQFLGDHLCFLEARVLTTLLIIVRSGLHGNNSTWERENVRFSWQNSTR